jgi:hypothetical protein
VPDAFQTGLLIPILKKINLDPCKASNYRPITISVTMSKILEMYILEDYTLDPSQFGFVKHRGTNTATSLAHDVSAYCRSRGSTVYLCSLDAEGTFDAIPHAVLFLKASDVLPDYSWRCLHNWYKHMTVQVKWASQLSVPIPVERGTRQGGLSSPFLFNIFYKELIGTLDLEKCGITIDGISYNVFCYADDILLASTTPTGLQKLIDVAVNYITRQGLRFNPTKTNCMIYGKSSFTCQPKWHIEDSELHIADNLTYLGAGLASDGGTTHTESRIKATQKAFYSLQHAGLHFKGCKPEVASHIFSMGVQTVLLYGCEAVYINKSNLKHLQSTQGNLTKAMLGLRRSSRTTPLLKALNIKDVSSVVHIQGANLLRSCLLYKSKASMFYSRLLCKMGQNDKALTLVHRSNSYFNDNGFNLLRYLMNDKYRYSINKELKCWVPDGQDGLIDSIRSLCTNFDNHARDLLQGLVTVTF